MSEPPRVYAADRDQWRRWLFEHHEQRDGIWLVYDRGPSRELSYDAIVEEALCFGWIDSKAGVLDAAHSMLWMAPRRPRSGWSRSNKERIDRLTAAGRMLPAGVAAVETAKERGTWTALDDVENLIEPAELRAALDAEPTARTHWDAFPRSAKRAILEWISTAKRPQTRATRIARTVTEAAQNRRAR